MEERFLMVEEGSYKWENRKHRNNPYGAYRLNSSETKEFMLLMTEQIFTHGTW